MTDSMDKKSKEERDKLDADLDAMLNEVQFQLPSVEELEEEEDAIDRLLKNAGFDGDQYLENDIENSQPDLSGFDGFGDDYIPKQPITDVESDGFSGLIESRQTELLPDSAAEGALVFEEDELDDFLGLGNDFNESDMIEDEQSSLSDSALPDSLAAVAAEDGLSDFSDFAGSEFVSQAPEETAPEETVTEVVVADEIDEYFGLANDFDLSDMIEDEPVETSTMSVTGFNLPLEKEMVDTEQEFDQFTDFSDFTEQEIVVQDTVEEIQQTVDATEENIDALFVADLAESFNEEGSVLGDDFRGEDMGQELEDLSSIKSESIDSLSEDEAAMDKLFGDEGNVFSETTQLNDNLSSDESFNEVEDFFKLNEVSDDFSKQIENQLAEAEKISTQDKQGDDFLLPDFDISDGFDSPEDDAGINQDQIDVSFADTDFLDQEDTQQDVLFDSPSFADEVFQPASVPVPENALITEKFEELTKNEKSDPYETGQEDFKKQLEEANAAVKKTKKLVYVALGFGVVAISTAVGLGVMAYNAKKEVTQLTETVTALEAGLVKMAQDNADKEVNAMVSSVVQLNQQVYGFITELKGSPQLPVDFIDNKAADLVVKQNMVSKALASLETKMGDALDNVSLQPIVLETHKPEVAIEPAELAPAKDSALNKVEVAHATDKETPAVEPVLSKKETVKEQLTAKEKVKPVATAKAEVKPEIASAKIEVKTEKATTKIEPTPTPAKVKVEAEVAPAKPVPAVSSTLKQESEKLKKQQVQVPEKWGVNLVAFKQEWFAKSKAAEFARQGVYAEVIPVTSNNSVLYRLRVGGFKNKAEATASKDKIKKVLNLDSVWVSDN